jgi:hypothetical protein
MPRDGIVNEVTSDMGFSVIDATIPSPGRYDTYPPRTEPPVWEREAIARIRSKLESVD